jgi:hypothetical protein
VFKQIVCVIAMELPTPPEVVPAALSAIEVSAQ